MSDLIPPMMPDDLDALIQTMERVQQLEAEVARLRLTDEEREAIETAAMIYEQGAKQMGHVEDGKRAVALRGMLKRLG